MPQPDAPHDSVPASAREFATTRWTVVLSAGQGQATEATKALSTLCQTYWYPLYAFVRRQGHNPHDAQDLTQAYFARLLERNYLADVDRAKGKFRSFLLASLKHFLANEWDRAKALKRGGGHQLISFDAQSAETRYRHEPADASSADRIFERRWALTLLEEVLGELRKAYTSEGNSQLFEALKPTLTLDRDAAPYAEIARHLHMSEGAVKVAVHRLRQRYRQQLRTQIAHTVSHPSEIDQEIRHLFSILSE